MAEQSAHSTRILQQTFAAMLDSALVALVLAVWGEVSRVLARSSLEQGNGRSRGAHGVTRRPRTTLGEEIVLPGTVQAYIEAPIYARTSGYLKDWRTDIGSQVTKVNCWPKSKRPKSISSCARRVADLATAHANEALSNSTNAALEGLARQPNRCPNRTRMRRRAMPPPKRPRADSAAAKSRGCANWNPSSAS